MAKPLKYPHKLAVRTDERDHAHVQETSAKLGLPVSQVARKSLAMGLGAYPPLGEEAAAGPQVDAVGGGTSDKGELSTQIEEAATELEIPVSEVVRGGLESGLEEFLFMARSRAFHNQRSGGKALSDSQLRRLVLNEAEVYQEQTLKESLVRKDDFEAVFLGERLHRDASPFCRCCGQYIREGERGSAWDRRLVVAKDLDRLARLTA